MSLVNERGRVRRLKFWFIIIDCKCIVDDLWPMTRFVKHISLSELRIVFGYFIYENNRGKLITSLIPYVSIRSTGSSVWFTHCLGVLSLDPLPWGFSSEDLFNSMWRSSGYWTNRVLCPESHDFGPVRVCLTLSTSGTDLSVMFGRSEPGVGRKTNLVWHKTLC